MVKRLAAMAAAFAPSRYWPALEEKCPVGSTAVLSGVLTFLAGGIGGVLAFLEYAAAQASGLNGAVLKLAEWQVAHPAGPGGEVSSTTAVGLNATAPFAFVFLTPAGWLTGYLVVSGGARAIAALVGDPMGDPLLTVADWSVRRLRDRRRLRHDAEQRLNAEGPEVPDRVVAGAAAGLPAADLVIVCSRVKAGWTAGTIVATSSQWYRLGAPVERVVAGRLRTLYPMTRHDDLEVARRVVHYELPSAPG